MRQKTVLFILAGVLFVLGGMYCGTLNLLTGGGT